MTKLRPVSPGEILLEEFMKPYGISQNKLARDIDVPPGRINQIIKSTRSITVETALKFSQYFGTTAQFWLNLQNHYDLRVAQQSYWPKMLKMIRPIELQPVLA